MHSCGVSGWIALKCVVGGEEAPLLTQSTRAPALVLSVSKVSLYIAAISVGAASISQVRQRTVIWGDKVSWQQHCKQVTK
jgi:hypothetical protein